MTYSYILFILNTNIIVFIQTKKFLIFKRINLSEKNRAILWLPMKTGSTHCWSIMKRFGFLNYQIDENSNRINLNKVDSFSHTHDHYLIDNHENYILIQTIRNPYEMFVSMFKYENFLLENEQFYIKTYERIYKNYMDFYFFEDRKPDYFLRLENLIEDYSKIPFIKNSEFFKSGSLENECRSPKNESLKKIIDWRLFYDQKSADLVYYNFAKTFERHGYDKNSWKNGD